MREILLASIPVLLGCPSVGGFGCLGDEQCDLEGTPGTCLADGDCAYVDDECASGLRRSPHAENEAGECVAVAGTTTGSTTTATSNPTLDESTGQPGCGVRKEVMIDTSLLSVGEPLVDYPALISFIDAELEGVVAEQLSFSDVDGTALAFEVEAFDSASGEIAAWVRLPAWTAGAPLSIYLRYGEGSPAPSLSAADVWAEHFLGVWHFAEPLRGDDGEIVRDSTSNAEHGFTVGEMTAEQTVDGVIGNALFFDGVDDSVDVDASFLGTLTSYTASGWLRIDDLDAQTGPMFSRLNGDGLYPRCRKSADDGGFRCQQDVETQLQGIGGSVEYGALTHVAVQRDADAGNMRLFLDGQSVGETSPATITGELDGGDLPVQIGRIGEFGSLYGMIDEFRVANVVLPEAWIVADHASQVLPANLLLAVQPQEPVACP